MAKYKSDKLEQRSWSIQEYLSIGYIYLLVLGIISDTIYFNFLGINILSYSNILDVLLSPIIYLTENIIVPVSLALLIGLMYLFGTTAPKIHKKYREKKWYRKMYNVEKLDEKYSTPASIHNLIKVSAVVILLFYLGMGVGRGIKVSEQIKDKVIKLDHKLIFLDKEELNVNIVGSNSQYLFYFTENESHVTISPIQQNIKKIEKIESK